ncbi:TPA: hypothetical protein ACSBVD_001297 [Acinetobacter baumannii]
MQIQIGIDIVLILAFLAYLSVVTGWNSKNKAAYIKQFRHGVRFTNVVGERSFPDYQAMAQLGKAKRISSLFV